MTLRQELMDAQAEVALIKAKIAKASCAEAGHDMTFAGCRNAGCDDDCSCSIPVYGCRVCGGCDFGQNDEAEDILRECPKRSKER